MRLWKKVLLGVAVTTLALLAVFVIVVGPWPTYGHGFENKAYYTKSLALLDESAKNIKIETPGPLQAGWGVADMTPDPVNVPLAGLEARRGKPATGVHDRLHVKALVVSDGNNHAVIVGSDMLLVPDNVAEGVHREVASQTPLRGDTILFSASHSHSGPGGLMKGLVAKTAMGAYDPLVVTHLTDAFTDAIVRAYRDMKPARIAHGSVDAKDLIRNRTREAEADGHLDYAVLTRDDGASCYLTRFSAHPTILGSNSFEFTAEYPGYLQQGIETAVTNSTAIYLGGGVGSSSTAGGKGEGFERAQSYGETLAKRILEQAAKGLTFEDHVPVASIGAPIELPPSQMRVGSPNWRISPILLHFLGLPTVGWIQCVRIGDLIVAGVPGDFSGEICLSWRQWGAQQNYTLWGTSFSGTYAGYISPDRYYDEVTEKNGEVAYETGIMSWCGPDQEAYFTALMQHSVKAMGAPPLTK